LVQKEEEDLKESVPMEMKKGLIALFVMFAATSLLTAAAFLISSFDTDEKDPPEDTGYTGEKKRTDEETVERPLDPETDTHYRYLGVSTTIVFNSIHTNYFEVYQALSSIYNSNITLNKTKPFPEYNIGWRFSIRMNYTAEGVGFSSLHLTIPPGVIVDSLEIFFRFHNESDIVARDWREFNDTDSFRFDRKKGDYSVKPVINTLSGLLGASPEPYEWRATYEHNNVRYGNGLLLLTLLLMGYDVFGLYG
jgi:hypothetical protein